LSRSYIATTRIFLERGDCSDTTNNLYTYINYTTFRHSTPTMIGNSSVESMYKRKSSTHHLIYFDYANERAPMEMSASMPGLVACRRQEPLRREFCVALYNYQQRHKTEQLRRVGPECLVVYNAGGRRVPRRVQMYFSSGIWGWIVTGRTTCTKRPIYQPLLSSLQQSLFCYPSNKLRRTSPQHDFARQQPSQQLATALLTPSSRTACLPEPRGGFPLTPDDNGSSLSKTCSTHYMTAEKVIGKAKKKE